MTRSFAGFVAVAVAGPSIIAHVRARFAIMSEPPGSLSAIRPIPLSARLLHALQHPVEHFHPRHRHAKLRGDLHRPPEDRLDLHRAALLAVDLHAGPISAHAVSHR